MSKLRDLHSGLISRFPWDTCRASVYCFSIWCILCEK